MTRIVTDLKGRINTDFHYEQIGLIAVSLVLVAMSASAQSNAPIEPPKKANARAATEAPQAAEPFDGASLKSWRASV